MEPDLRGPKARRLLAAEEKDHAGTRNRLDQAEAECAAVKGECARLTATLADTARALELAETRISEDTEDMAEDDIALGCLTDIIAERDNMILALTKKIEDYGPKAPDDEFGFR